jgi:hypothetical protein
MAQFGFSMRHWQQIKKGRPISVTTLLRIGEIFKIGLDDLLHGLDQDDFRLIENGNPTPPTTPS